MLSELKILGLRGFATEQSLRFAQPNGQPGSGLTVLVGANNAGKSTVIEALRALAQSEAPSFTQGRRNISAGDQVRLMLVDSAGNSTTLRSLVPSGSETTWDIVGTRVRPNSILVIPSRRTFNPFFSKSLSERESYIGQMGFPSIRTSSVDVFSYRLFRAQQNLEAFNEVLVKVLDPVPQWTIDQTDTGQYFLKILTGGLSHSSEGLGEGLVSLFFIVDALYDSQPGSVIAIDEPELSLHPSLQRKLSALITDYASDRQIIVSTHSPYFINLESLQSGAVVVRAYLRDGHSILAQLSSATAGRVAGLLRNYNNPHIFGLEAQEVFFLEDPVILVEGQEDVIFYDLVQRNVGETLKGVFYGWGVGGAGNMGTIAAVLRDLGFAKVVGFLDGNKTAQLPKLKRDFPDFKFFAIPADDVRTKEARDMPAVQGLLDDENRAVRPGLVAPTRALFRKANAYLSA